MIFLLTEYLGVFIVIIHVVEMEERMFITAALETCDNYDLEFLTAIENRVEAVPGSDCLAWTGHVHGTTPVKSYRGRRRSVRQILYRLMVDPEGQPKLTVNCDTPLCLNPNHIVRWTGPGNEMPFKPRMLSVDERAEIMATPNVYGSGVQLAKRFKVSPSLVSRVRHQLRDERVGIRQ